MTRLYVYGLLLVAVLVTIILVRNEWAKQAAWDAVDRQLSKGTDSLTRVRIKDQVLVKSAKRHKLDVDSANLPLIAKAVVARNKVGVYNDTTVAIRRDNEVSLHTVPPEVVQLILADSVALQAQERRVGVRDTLLIKIDTLLAIDSTLLQHKDSVITHLEDRPGTPLWKKVAGVGAVLGVVTWVLRR